MTKKEFEKELKHYDELGISAVAYFKRDIEKYCKLITPLNYPFSNRLDSIVVFNLKKIRKDNIHYIPNHIDKIETNLNRVLYMSDSSASWGYDGFRVLLQDLIEEAEKELNFNK